MKDDDSARGPAGYGPSSRRTLPYPDPPKERHDAAARALELATSAVRAVKSVQEDVSEIKEALGRAPAPGRPGSGLVGTVMQMQETLDRLVRAEEARAKAPPPRRTLSRSTIIAAIAAIGAAGAGMIHAWRGADPPVAPLPPATTRNE